MKKQEDIYLSEFRVVKCKKCDAALTEMEGEKLTGCIQCGYSFNIPGNENKNKRPHAISNKIKESLEYKKYLKKIQNKSFSSDNIPENESEYKYNGPHAISNKTKETPEYKRYLKKIQDKNFSSYTFDEAENTSSEDGDSLDDFIQLETNITEDIKSEISKPKTSIVGAIVKWYFIIFISISVLSQCFNR